MVTPPAKHPEWIDRYVTPASGSAREKEKAMGDTERAIAIEGRLSRLEVSVESLTSDVKSLVGLARSDRKLLKWAIGSLVAVYTGGSVVLPNLRHDSPNAEAIAKAIREAATNEKERAKEWEAFKARFSGEPVK